MKNATLKRRRAGMILALALIAILLIGTAAPAYAASKKTVYVLTKIQLVDQGSTTTLNKYTYNKNGLLKTSKLVGLQKGQYKYDSKNRIKQYRRSFNQWATFKYTYKDGRITKTDTGYYSMSNGKLEYDGLHSVYTYNGKGLVKKEVVTGKFWNEKKGKEVKKTYTNTFTYNSKKLPSKAVIKTPDTQGTYTFRYDAKKNLSSMVLKSSWGKSTMKATNTYDKKGRLTRRVVESSYPGEDLPDKYTYKYTYKKMTVSKGLADKISSQQWLLLNGHLNTRLSMNFAVPVNDYNGM